MARAEADMCVTPAGSPTPEPPYAVVSMGSAAVDDDDEEAQMLQGRVCTSKSLHPQTPVRQDRRCCCLISS